MRRHVTESLEHRERKVRRGQFVREALTDETCELLLMVERIDARDHAAGAVPEHEHRQSGLARFREPDDRRDVAHPIRQPVDEEAFAVRLAAPAQIRRVHGHAAADKLLRHPQVFAAVRVEAVDDDDHRARRRFRVPGPQEDRLTAADLQPFFARAESLRHRVPP